MDLSKIKRRELLRFLIGGGSAVVVDYLLYQVFLRTGIFLSGAKAASFFCGAVVGFVINKLWTFESRRFVGNEIGRYILLYSVSACTNTIINRAVLLLTELELVAFFCATGTSTIINFLGQKFFVFRRREE